MISGKYVFAAGFAISLIASKALAIFPLVLAPPLFVAIDAHDEKEQKEIRQRASYFAECILTTAPQVKEYIKFHNDNKTSYDDFKVAYDKAADYNSRQEILSAIHARDNKNPFLEAAVKSVRCTSMFALKPQIDNLYFSNSPQCKADSWNQNFCQGEQSLKYLVALADSHSQVLHSAIQENYQNINNKISNIKNILGNLEVNPNSSAEYAKAIKTISDTYHYLENIKSDKQNRKELAVRLNQAKQYSKEWRRLMKDLNSLGKQESIRIKENEKITLKDKEAKKMMQSLKDSVVYVLSRKQFSDQYTQVKYNYREWSLNKKKIAKMFSDYEFIALAKHFISQMP
jgi:hypothetical protein